MGTQQDKPKLATFEVIKKARKALAVAKAKEVQKGLNTLLVEDFQKETVAKYQATSMRARLTAKTLVNEAD
jgi:hypothetical protein